jgi:hypothetical protein
VELSSSFSAIAPCSRRVGVEGVIGELEWGTGGELPVG